jgi:hypothetical protein
MSSERLMTRRALFAGYALAAAALMGVFMLYQSPEFLRTLADGIWACF